MPRPFEDFQEDFKMELLKKGFPGKVGLRAIQTSFQTLCYSHQLFNWFYTRIVYESVGKDCRKRMRFFFNLCGKITEVRSTWNQGPEIDRLSHVAGSAWSAFCVTCWLTINLYVLVLSLSVSARTFIIPTDYLFTHFGVALSRSTFLVREWKFF